MVSNRPGCIKICVYVLAGNSRNGYSKQCHEKHEKREENYGNRDKIDELKNLRLFHELRSKLMFLLKFLDYFDFYYHLSMKNKQIKNSNGKNSSR